MCNVVVVEMIRYVGADDTFEEGQTGQRKWKRFPYVGADDPSKQIRLDSICCLLFFHRESIVHLLVRSNIFEKIKLM